MRLTSARWLEEESVRRVCALFSEAGVRAFFVGGCVRNSLLGSPVADIDLATEARPEQVINLAGSAGIRAVPTGIEHGTVTLVVAGRPFEVTTFRRDVRSHGRHADVEFSDDIAGDARRRDFTMNALYADCAGNVTDPLGGMADLRDRRVRFIGDAGRRIEEDYLRILRFFRFHAWYGDAGRGLDKNSLAACREHRGGLAGLSRERVGAEMTRLLAASSCAQSVAAMERARILRLVLPGSAPEVLTGLEAVETAAGAGPRWQRRLAAMGSDPAWTGALRLSKADRKTLAAIATALKRPEPPDVLAWRYGTDSARDAVLIAAARDGRPFSGELEALLRLGTEARFPVRSADLDLTGPQLGQALRSMQEDWAQSGFRLDAEALRQRYARSGR